jgi:hypothetical protein
MDIDFKKLLKSEHQVNRYKDFWLPWLDMVQTFLEKQGIKMVYEWSMINHRLEFATVFTIDESEYLTITFCGWGKSPEYLRRTSNEYIQRIIFEKNLKETKIV